MPHALAIFLLAILTLPVFGSQRPDGGSVGNLMATSNYDALISKLETLRSKDPKRFNSSADAYLLGRIYQKKGEFARAASIYADVCARNDGLQLYAQKHLSRLARVSGNLPLERLFLRELAFAPKPNLATAGAAPRLAANYYESGDYPAVIDLVQNGYGSRPGVQPEFESSRELESLIAQALLSNGDTSLARNAFEQLIDTVPDPDQPDDFSLRAVAGLDKIDGRTAKDAADTREISASEHIRRGEIYQFNRDFENARLHFETIVQKQESEDLVPEAMYQIGRGYVQERNYKTAVEWFERLRTEFPEHKLAGSALYGAAGSFANLEETGKAVDYYSRFIEEDPADGVLVRAYLNIVDAYRDAGKIKLALSWSRKAQESFKNEAGETVALFAEAKLFIAAEDWQAAYDALQRLSVQRLGTGTNIAGGTTKTEIQFLRAMVLEKLHRTAEAESAYREIPSDWREYYGWRAGDRLQQVARLESKGARGSGAVAGARSPVRLQQTPADNRSGQSQDIEIPAMREVRLDVGNGFAKSLLRLGLFDEAAPELEVALRNARGVTGTDLTDLDENTAFTLAELYAKGDFADRAIRFIEPRWKRVPRGFDVAQIPRAQALLLYPVPFRDALLRHCASHDVDPRFILSIMRQESRFQSDIKSAAAARGLMQFVSGTSDRIATELGVDGFDQNDLYDPDTAIRFGAKYVANILRDFPGELPAVAASYNGGEDRMARWIKRANSKDPDRYVPEIVFPQTKDYTYRVMSNYRMYTILYDKNLLPK